MIEQLLAYNTIVVLLGVSILGAGAGMVGSFAVLRKRALTGDAVAHAALPGVCVAFLILGRDLSNLRICRAGHRFPYARESGRRFEDRSWHTSTDWQ